MLRSVRAVLTALALVAVVMVACVSVVIRSNPIPAPTIILEHEYIDIAFRASVGEGRVYVRVTGLYPFRNVGFKELDMYFPVPPEVVEGGEAWVSVNGHPVKYEVVEEGMVALPGGGAKPFKYDSALGVLPMLKWRIKLNGSSEEFTVNVTYKYSVGLTEIEVPCNCTPSGKVGIAVYRTIYAMATGRFYYVYSKRVVADVTIRFLRGFDRSTVNITLAPPPKEMGEGYTELTLHPKDGEAIHLTVASDLFKGLRKDLVFDMVIPWVVPTTTWTPHTTSPVTTSNTGEVSSSSTTASPANNVTDAGNTANQSTSTQQSSTSLPNSNGPKYLSPALVAVVAALCVAIVAVLASRRRK